MIRSVGIDFGISGPHKVQVLDEGAQLYDGFKFQSTPEGLATLEERIFQDGANPIIVFEPTSLTWLPVAIYIRARHPECRLVRAKGQKVAALRKYLRGRSKSDRIDALTLAKMPFIDPEQLDNVYLPPAKFHTLQRLTRQRQRLEKEITARKNRISALIDSYLPGLWRVFSDPWSPQARTFYRCKLNPFAVVQAGEEALHSFLAEAASRSKGCLVEAHQVYAACHNIATLYELSAEAGVVDEGFFTDFQEEIARELRLMEAEETETETEAIAEHAEELYRKLHPQDYLRTIPGVGEHTAPVFLAAVGAPERFRNQSAFANWNGVVPGARQSSQVEGKGLRMTKAGPAIMKCGLYQAGDVGRRYDPQLAYVYHRQMVYHGKTHKQAMGAVMSHMGARVLTVLRENRPYELRDVQGNPISREEARRLILEYKVLEEIRRERRQRNPSRGNARKVAAKNQGMLEIYRTHEAAYAPQPGITPLIPQNLVYSISAKKAR